MGEKVFIKNTDELSNNINKVELSDCDVYVSSITNLDSLKYFNSITRLSIGALDSLELCEDIIVDTTNLKYLTNLTDLFIENDDHIETLNLYNLNKLKNLFISSCHLLRNINGFENLKNIKTLVVYDVPNLDINFYTKLINYLSNSKIEKIVLDINTYNLFDEKQKEVLKEHNVFFSEKIGIRDNYVFSTKMMEDYNKRVLKVYQAIHENYKNKDEVLHKIYEYVKSINYDEEALAKRQKYILDGGKFHKFNNKFKSINSSYKALMQNAAVCEGYVNLLRYFYKLENVDLYPVFCEYKGQSHVAAKALIDGSELYFDPELDHRFNNDNNYMISKENFNVNHDLLFNRDNFDIIIEVKGKAREK